MGKLTFPIKNPKLKEKRLISTNLLTFQEQMSRKKGTEELLSKDK